MCAEADRRQPLGLDADDQHGRVPGPRVALVEGDDLAVVRDRAVPAKVIARPDIDDVVALAQPETPAQHDVMLVTGVAVRAHARTDLRGLDLDDRDVA